MATNPMQKQARNSFLLGMIFTLLITGAIIVFLFMNMKKLNDKIKQDELSNVTVYVLNKDVKSGQVLTADLFTPQKVKRTGVPADATSDIQTLLSSYALCDSSGNHIYTKYKDNGEVDYMYILKSSSAQTGENNVPNTTNTSTTSNTTNVTNTTEGTNANSTSASDEIKVYKDNATNSYYTLASNGTKEPLETTQQALIAKVDLKANTVMTGAVIARNDELVTDDVRQQEYNMMSLPIDLITDDYVDIRLMLPTGQDFIVVTKKKVTVPVVNGAYLSDTIQMNMSEDEILVTSSAIVEAYKMEGAKLYVTKYTEAGLQEAAKPTYVANREVTVLIENNPNIVAEAKAALRERYSNELKKVREDWINGAVSNYGKDENVSQGMDESITSTQEARQQYLQSLPVGGATGAASTTGAGAGTGAAASGATSSGATSSGAATTTTP